MAAHLPIRHPANIIVCGCTQSGKTRWVLKLIEHSEVMLAPPPRKILYCYSEYQSETFEPFEQRVQFYKGIPSLDIFDGQVPTMVVLDDLMGELNKDVQELFTRVSHHRNVTAIFITQNLFPKNPYARTISLNAHYLVLYKNPRDVGQFTVLARQMYGTDYQFAVEAFHDATAQPHSYLLLDLRPETEESYRLRTCIFPGEQTYVYVSRKLYKPDGW